MSNDNLANDLEKFKYKYYDENKKNVFFKKDQKMDLANKVCTEFDITQLINKTIYIISGTNKIYVDYTIFKLYANPSIFEIIITHVQDLSMRLIQEYGVFE
jgi:hypothetical protein